MSEVLSVIGEKSAILERKEIEKNFESAKSLLHKHKKFENDLATLQTQLQVLIDDSAVLQAQCTGSNGNHIAQ